MCFTRFYYSIENILWLGNENKLEAFNFTSRNGTIYAYNDLSIVIIQVALILILLKIMHNLLTGKSIKYLIAIFIFLIYNDLNLSTLFPNAASLRDKLGMIVLILVNNFIFAQVFSYYTNEVSIKDELFKVKLPIFICILYLISYWTYFVGGISLLCFMSMKYNIIEKIKGA